MRGPRRQAVAPLPPRARRQGRNSAGTNCCKAGVRASRPSSGAERPQRVGHAIGQEHIRRMHAGQIAAACRPGRGDEIGEPGRQHAPLRGAGELPQADAGQRAQRHARPARASAAPGRVRRAPDRSATRGPPTGHRPSFGRYRGFRQRQRARRCSAHSALACRDTRPRQAAPNRPAARRRGRRPGSVSTPPPQTRRNSGRRSATACAAPSSQKKRNVAMAARLQFLLHIRRPHASIVCLRSPTVPMNS